MDATQRICDSILESDEENHEDESENKRGRPLAKLCILKNAHIPETEVPLFLGENALGRDPNSCAVPLIAPSISKQHATICLSVYRKRGRHSEVDIQALVWDQGSMNGTRKGQMKLTPNVRYALSERDSLVVADIPCQYVSCAENAVSSQGDARTAVSRHSGVKATLLHATSTGGKKYVNGGTGARVSLPDQEDTMKTPGVTTVLSFEQTPTYPEESLVPESDSDSDGERGKRRRKAIVSDSDSHTSSPRCSTFLSPTNKTVPESEDESTITPSSSTKNRPRRHVSFSLEETDMDAGRQQLDNKKTVEIADDSAEEEHGEEESEQHVPPVKTGSNVRLTGQDPEFTPSVFTDPIPVFDMDSDTDEEEEEGACPVTLTTNQQADQPPDTAQFHMDSDTDVDEDDEALDQVPKSVPSSADHDKPHVIAVIQPEGVTMDSDTDVDDDAMSDAATNAKPPSLLSTQTADSAFSTQVENVHLDSDTDVDEEEEMERGTHNKYPEIDETAPDSLQLDGDTDGEAIPAPALGEPASLSESCTAAQPGADLDILSDSDTDEEEDSALFIALVVLDVSVDPGTSDEADPDVGESAVPPAGDAADLKEDSDTDVEDAAESQIPSLQREMAPGLLAPLQQNCSTPVPLTEGGLEDMDTQAFFTPSAVPYRRAVAPAVRRMVLSASSGSQEDLVMAETQSFVLQTRGRQAFSLESSGDEQSSREASFQFALSDSIHLQGQALAMENTQTFVGGDVSVSMEDTQAYAAVSNADGTSLESDPNLEATQAYGKEAEPAGCSVTSAKESQVDFDLKDTQEFISMPDSDSEDDTDDEDDDDESRNTATAATQAFDVPTSSTLAMSETQLMPVFEEDESSDEDNLFSSVLQVKRDGDGEADQPQKKHHSEALSVAETQPMHKSDDEESDDEDLIPGPRKRKAKPPQLDEEPTQTLSNSELSLETQPMHMGVSETQPMATSEDEESDDEESDDEDSMPGPRKRRAKPLQLDEEPTQTLSNSELSAVQTQPMDGNEEGESDEGETPPLASSSDVSAVETQPAGEDEEIDDEEDSILRPRKRKAKPLQIQEEGTQPLTSSEEREDQSERERKEEQERLESEKTEREEMERMEREANERVEKEEQETLKRENERIEKAEEMERLERERIEREEDMERLARERIKREEEMERLERERIEREEEMERLERERIQREEEMERLERERIKREEEMERLERERREMERKEKEEKEKLEVAKRELGERLERIEQEHQAKLEREAKEKEEGDGLEEEEEKREEEKRKEEKQEEEKQEEEKQEEEKKSKPPARSRRATRATTAAPPRSAEAEADSTSANDDVPARRTRSRSNSSNSVSSERSTSSVSSLGGRGRGRGAKRGSSAPPPAASTRGTDRRRRNTVSTQQDTNDAPPPPPPLPPLPLPPPGTQSRSKVSSCSVSSQSRGGRGGGRQRGRGGKTEPIPAINIQSEQIVDPTPAARGRKSRRGEQLPQEVDTEQADPQQADPQQADPQQAPTTRGRRRANVSEPNAAERQDNSSQGCASGESPLPKRTVRGRAVQSETVEAPAAPAGSEGDREVGKGRKRDLEEANTEEASSSGSHKVFPGKREAPAPEEAGGTNDETPVPAKRRGRASNAQANKVAGVSSAKVEGSEESETREEVPVQKRGRGRPSVAQRKMKEEQEESGLSVDRAEASEPQTPTSAASRKRQALADSSPVAKTPRSSSASPGGRLRSVSHAYKVLFTGVVDEEGERVLARLGGRLAKGVADMNCLVTDKVRRTVKFLCAVAKGVPIVTTHWLEKSCKAGSFLSPNAFAVEDPEQENRFSFCLQESLRIASSQPLLQGYHIHVTESVQPEPVQMKDIIFCSGATLLPKMPSSPKPQTFVISCEEDLSLCGPALSASLPVFTAEFLLTGILQQRLDHQTHRLSAAAHSLQPAGGRGRGRKKT